MWQPRKCPNRAGVILEFVPHHDGSAILFDEISEPGDVSVPYLEQVIISFKESQSHLSCE